MIILVGGEKGGSGKSCLAQNIAVYLRTEKGAKVLMVDCDPQRTTSDWIKSVKLTLVSLKLTVFSYTVKYVTNYLACVSITITL